MGSAHGPRRRAWALAAQLLAAGVVPLLLGGGAAADPGVDYGRLSLGSGVDYSRGDYDSEDTTEILYATGLVAYLSPEIPWSGWLADWLELRATLPFLEIEGPGVVDRGAGRLPGGRSTERHGGVGDLRLRASYTFQPTAAAQLPLADLSLEVKLPTADEQRGLGTGETDLTLGAGLAQRLGGLTPFASVAHRWTGDPPGLSLRNRWLVSVGASQRLGDAFSLGVLYDWREASTRDAADAHELVPFLWWQRGAVRVGPYGVLGLSEGSPDYALGLQLRVDFDLRGDTEASR